MVKQTKAIVIASMFAITGVNADSSSENAASALNQALQMIEMPSDAPDWMKRTSINISVEQEFKPKWELETVQPIYQLDDTDMFFWQFNTSYRNDINTYNFGLGYRNIINPEIMLGINSFYDYQQDNKHKRWSIGLEAIGQKFEARANRYWAISDKKEVKTNIYEEALDGWDAEVGGKVIPNFDLKLFAQYTVWEGVQMDDYKQRSIRATYPVNDSIDFELEYIDDIKKQASLDDTRFAAQLKISLGKKSSKSMNLDRSENLKDKLLIPVERENEIIVEKTVTSGGISIGRAN